MTQILSNEEARVLLNKEQKGPNKMRNKPTKYGGRLYPSKKEADYAQGLDWKLRQGEIKAWTPQVTYRLEVNGVLITTYVLDFLIEHNDGSFEHPDVKGRKAGVQYQLFKVKKHLMLAVWGIEVKEV